MRHANRRPPRREIQGALGLLAAFGGVGLIVAYLFLRASA